MKNPTLVILAAGMGSRFGGLKQIEPVDLGGHLIIDFSLFDAWRAGFRIDFDYIAPDPTGEELTNFFEQVAKKNWLDFDGVTFGEEDTVLTLSTCCRKYDEYNTGNQRLVLMAKLLPEGAIAQDFTVRLAPEPEMP